jgi:hypothetical protein
MNAIDEVLLFARDYVDVKQFRTSYRKQKIREAYEIATGKKIIITCSTCYIEALMEILKYNPMATKKGYELKKGVLLQAFGDASKTCTNDTLTDELAEWYLRHFPEKAIYFSKIPVNKVKPAPPADIKIVKPKVAEVVKPPEPDVPGKVMAEALGDVTGKPPEPTESPVEKEKPEKKPRKRTAKKKIVKKE